MTTESSENGAISLSHVNLSGYMGDVTVFRSLHTLGCVSK